MQRRGEPDQKEEKRRSKRENCFEPHPRVSKDHPKSYAEKTCDKREILKIRKDADFGR
jgi:hypothetical protein